MMGSDELRGNVAKLEESVVALRDLAICLPEHSEWLWRMADKFALEVSVLRDSVNG